MENKETLVLKGKIKFLSFGKSKNDNEEKFRLSMEIENKKDVLDTLTDTFTNCLMKPHIISDKDTNIINIKSKFTYPVKILDAECDVKEEIEDISDFIEYGYTQDASVSMKVKCKKDDKTGAIYPVALKVHKIGSKYDVFGDF